MGANDLPSFSKRKPSNPEGQNFNYSALETETRIVLQQYTRDIKSLIRRTSQDIIEIGEKLSEVKQQLDYPPNNQAQMEMELLFNIGHDLCITDIEQQNYKWLGKIAEVKKVTASDTNLVITISCQLASDDKTVENNSYCIAKTDVTLARVI